MLRGLPKEVLLRLPRVGGEFTRGRNRLRVVRGRFRHQLRVELIFADQRGVDPWQLMVAVLLPNVVPNPTHDRVDGDAGIEQMSEEGLRERAVRASRPVEGGALRVA